MPGAAAAMARAGKLGRDWASPPPLDPWQRLVWQAFSDLGSERTWSSVGSAQTAIAAIPGPIPFRAVMAWADEARLTDPDRRADLRTLVAHLDALWLEDVSRRRS